MGISWGYCERIRPSRSLRRNHWTAFDQTCYMTTPHDKGYIIFPSVRPTVHPIGIRPSLFPLHYLLLPQDYLLQPVNHGPEFNQSCYMSLPHGKGMQEQHYFCVLPSIRPASVHPKVALSPPKPLGRIYTNLLHVFLGR